MPTLLDDRVATKDIFGGPVKVLTQTEGVFLGSSRSNTRNVLTFCPWTVPFKILTPMMT